jgi:hypothetical protein
MANVRVVRAPGSLPTQTVNGRTYTLLAAGNVADVPNFDAGQLAANGWWQLGTGAVLGSGPTSARPTTGLAPGGVYIDTTLGAPVFWCAPTALAQSQGIAGFWTDFAGNTV